MKRTEPVYLAYVPHGMNTKYYYPIKDGENEDYEKFKEKFQKQHPADFIIFWNNRNIRRKQPGDVILAYRAFCDKLSKKKAANVLLLMHTQVRDENGTDLQMVKDMICPEYRIVFSDQKLSTKDLNHYYNMADVTVNVASNEGFGLSGAESLMAGTPIINNVTGGLQDHCRFEDENGNWIKFDAEFSSNHIKRYIKCGEWAFPVFPASRSLQGSLPTPYIFDDRCKFEDVADQLYILYKMSREERKRRGMEGHKWVMSKESGMSAPEMSNRFKKHIDFLLETWEPPKRFTMEKVERQGPENKYVGITWEN